MALNMPDAPWVYFCLSMWMDPAEDERNMAWARGFAEAMQAFGVGAAVSRTSSSRTRAIARLRASFGPEKYERLVALKREWDPDNVFRLNQNIAPNGGLRRAAAARAQAAPKWLRSRRWRWRKIAAMTARCRRPIRACAARTRRGR